MSYTEPQRRRHGITTERCHERNNHEHGLSVIFSTRRSCEFELCGNVDMKADVAPKSRFDICSRVSGNFNSRIEFCHLLFGMGK